jgi:hypothetical protein
METVVHALGLVALFAACTLGLVSLLFGLPGTFFILLAALVYAWATAFGAIHWSTLGWLLALALVGEGLELVAGSATAGGAKPSWRVVLSTLGGSIVGGIIGTPFFFGIGALVGALIGAFVGAAAAVASEGAGFETVMSTGFAAMQGRLLGFVLKSSIAVVMVVLIGIAVL